MSFKFHQLGLTKICRICTYRIKITKFNRKPTICKDYCKEIQGVFDINIWDDSPEQHPHNLCELCARKVRHQRSGTRNYCHKQATCTQHIQRDWPKHQRTGYCYVCSLVTSQAKGGCRTANKKAKRGGYIHVQNEQLTAPNLPFDVGSHNIFEHLIMPTLTGQQQVPPNLEVFGHDEQNLFTCAICVCILSRPSVQTPCQHNFCATCLSNYFTHNKVAKIKCPVCLVSIHVNNITASP